MTGNPSTPTHYRILCAENDPELRGTLLRDLERILNTMLEVEAFGDAAELLRRADELDRQGVRIPLVIVDHSLPGTTGADVLIALHEKEASRLTRKILLSGRSTIKDLSRALNRGALNGNLTKPWSYEVLDDCVRHLLTEYFINHAPEDIGRLGVLVDLTQLSHAFVATERSRRVLDRQVRTLQQSFLADMDLSDDEAEQAMIEGFDRALEHPPRKQLPEGSILLREGQPVDGISILVEGQVQMSRQAGNREIVFHSVSAGRVIGLLALAHRRQAFYTCRAVTEVVVVELSLNEVEQALQANPSLANHFVTVLIRSMATRNRHAAEMQVEIETLNAALAKERDQLADTLQQLKSAQMRLVESEKKATLGQLSAGVAHELNNPIAAIHRAAEYIRDDLLALVGQLPDGERARSALLSTLSSTPLSTRQQRERREELTSVLGDEALARQLLKVGIYTLDEYQARLGDASPAERERRLAVMERYNQLGVSLRNMQSCAQRVTAIVKSLRSYARADQALVSNVDLHEGIEDTLLLFGHGLNEVTIEREFGDLPRIECHPGEINQVWTNVISNALQAMEYRGNLRIETTRTDADHVQVRIIDNGPGIAPENLSKVFDLNFTTKHSKSQFGLGLGLAICRQIVERHGGQLSIESAPGRTCVTVLLPIRSPGESQEERTP